MIVRLSHSRSGSWVLMRSAPAPAKLARRNGAAEAVAWRNYASCSSAPRPASAWRRARLVLTICRPTRRCRQISWPRPRRPNRRAAAARPHCRSHPLVARAARPRAQFVGRACRRREPDARSRAEPPAGSARAGGRRRRDGIAVARGNRRRRLGTGSDLARGRACRRSSRPRTALASPRSTTSSASMPAGNSISSASCGAKSRRRITTSRPRSPPATSCSFRSSPT